MDDSAISLNARFKDEVFGMTAIQDSATPDEVSSATDVHYQTVSQRVPQWLIEATAQERQALRASVPRPMPWLARAGVNLPDVLQNVRDEYQRHQMHAKAVAGYLAQLPSVEDFAEPLLRDALKSTFGMDLDVRKTFLFNAARARIDESRITVGDPLTRAFKVVKAATQPLLQAALQNFEAFEAEENGMRDDRRPSKIFASDSGLPLDPEREIDIVPERFAALCRKLDLGGRYQRLIRSVFEPHPAQGERAEVATMNRQAWFKLYEQSSLRLNLHLAYLQSWIDQGQYDDLLEVIRTGKATAGLGCATLKLWGVELNGIVLFFRPFAGGVDTHGLLVYLPDEAQQPYRQFPSIKVFHDWLRERLQDPAWRSYFWRFVPARERDRLAQHLHQALYPKVWNPGGWYEERFDPNAMLRLSKVDCTSALYAMLLQRKIAVLKDDGLFHAVPTAAQDHKSAEEKVDYFLGVGFNVFNVAAFVVPGLGEVMLAVNAAMLGYEVYEGFDSLARDEREQAWGYFMDVGENLAIMAALGAAGAAAHRFSGNLPMAVRSMRPVTLEDGTVRLWKPDLTPFAYDVELPADVQPGENGLYAWRGREWLKLEGRYYSVRTLMGAEQGYRIEHPEHAWAYEPSVRHNGNGGWVHEVETPQQWRGVELFRRQGHREANVSADMAQRALHISGISEGQLRQTLVDSRRPPALLTDSLRRLVLAEQMGVTTLDSEAFAAAYDRQQPKLSAQGQLLQRQFGTLPNGIVEELIGAANGHELSEMAITGRVPLRLAEEARIYQQQVRIARACEGLYLDLDANPDTARLLLHGLESLPGWPAKLRLALYEDSVKGQALASIGPEQEPAVAVLWRGRRPHAFCQALVDAIPAAAREALGLSDAASLLGKLQEQGLAPRQRLRQWLGMQPLKPAFRSPMRLADGRVGYPLSGRGHPFFTEDELLDKLRLLELDDLYVEDALRALHARGLDRLAIARHLDRALDEMLLLRQALDRWVLDSAGQSLSQARQRSREMIGCALWDHWRRGVLPQLGRPAPRLILSRIQLIDLPAQLPDFFTTQVREVLLDEVIHCEGEPRQQIIDGARMEALARLFPNLTSIDIRSGAFGTGVPQAIARAWPQLASLGLREFSVMIGHLDLQVLARLPRLRRLSLHGSRLHELPAAALHGFDLDYLGLDWLGLGEWPQWLDNIALLDLGELSLVGNHITEVPELILADVTPVDRPTRVYVQGNQFGFQALLDMVLAESFHGRFNFRLDLSPAMEDLMRQRIQERAQLQAALDVWRESGQDTVPLVPEHVAYRQRLSGVLMAYWRDELRGAGTALLCLDDVVLDDFPQNLPPFFLPRVRRLDLSRFHATGNSLETFVRQFPQLIELSLIRGQPALAGVPEFLTTLPNLRELALVRMGMTIDQAAMEAFGRMPMLSSLQLDGNALGQIADVSMFSQRYFGFFGLAQMGISTWPQWLDPMLPNGIELLSLDDNLLTSLPERLLINSRSETGAVEISLHNNPLTREVMIRAHTSQHFNRPYTFTMDLPDEIAAMAPEAHDSDSEEPGSPGDDGSQSDDDPAVTWETADVDLNERNQQLWERLEARDDTDALLGLVGRLRHSADYRSPAVRPELVERVWRVLAAVDEDPGLRQTLNAMAREPLRQVHQHDTCPDGIRLEFNQMELQVYTHQALRNVPEESRGPTLFRLMRSLYRSATLDRLAREQANGRDEAEVRLAYRLRWAEQLQLPLPPRGMLYRGAANLAPGELDLAMTRLQLEEAGQGLQRFAAQCDFWVAYLRETFAERFKTLKDEYEAAVLSVVDANPEDSAEQSSARIRALEATFKRDEQALLQQLTLAQSLSSN